MDQVLVEYVAEAVARDLLHRPGHITPDLARAIYGSEELRRATQGRVAFEHFEALKQLYASGDPALEAFSIDLLLPLTGRAEVQSFLEQRWQSINLGVDAQRGIQFRLADSKDLTASLRDELRAWTFANWRVWLAGVARFAGGEHAALSFFQGRLNERGDGRRFPDSKRWIYVCCAASSNEKEAARNWIQSFIGDTDPFVAETARMVRGRLA